MQRYSQINIKTKKVLYKTDYRLKNQFWNFQIHCNEILQTNGRTLPTMEV